MSCNLCLGLRASNSDVCDAYWACTKLVQLHKSIHLNRNEIINHQVNPMSDHLRSSTCFAGQSQPISRPDWPWAARTYSQGSPRKSPFASSSVLGSNLHSSWDPRGSVTSNSSQGGYSGTNPGRNNSTPKPLHCTTRESTRQWTFMVPESPNIYSRVSSPIIRDLNGIFVMSTN